MNPQLISGNIYAVPRTSEPLPMGEKLLLENAVRQARANTQRAANALTTALQRLRLKNNDTTALSNAMWHLLHRAFLIGNEPSTEKMIQRIETVRQKFEITRAGLQSRLEIVDLPQKDFADNMKQALAYANKRTLTLPAPGFYILPARPTGLFGYVRGATPSVAGRIHIAFGYLFDTDLSTWTLIHEATHKFAGTKDNAYWSSLQSKWQKPLEVKQAIDNADSYAVFAMQYRDSFLWG